MKKLSSRLKLCRNNVLKLLRITKFFQRTSKLTKFLSANSTVIHKT